MNNSQVRSIVGKSTGTKSMATILSCLLFLFLFTGCVPDFLGAASAEQEQKKAQATLTVRQADLDLQAQTQKVADDHAQADANANLTQARAAQVEAEARARELEARANAQARETEAAAQASARATEAANAAREADAQIRQVDSQTALNAQYANESASRQGVNDATAQIAYAQATLTAVQTASLQNQDRFNGSLLSLAAFTSVLVLLLAILVASVVLRRPSIVVRRVAMPAPAYPIRVLPPEDPAGSALVVRPGSDLAYLGQCPARRTQ